MHAVLQFIKKEPVLTASGLLAAASVFAVLPDGVSFDGINWQVLAILYCLMTVVAGLRKSGVFDALTCALTRLTCSTALLTALLTLLCFLISALITNDVALLTFVPFTIGLFGAGRRKQLVYALVLETIAANLGSLMTPMGNPQNLYLYAHYAMTGRAFFSVMLPLGGVCLLVTGILTLFAPHGQLDVRPGAPLPRIRPACFAVFCTLFAVCLLCVLKIVAWYVLLPVVCAAEIIYDRSVMKEADFSLLLTFVFFFVFVGNVSRIDAVRAAAERALSGREILVSALVSQVISNVPAAAMLSAFTDNAAALLWGTNIGGLGTPVASMASLITFRFYAAADAGGSRRYLAVFSALNFTLLAVLLAAAPLLLRLL